MLIQCPECKEWISQWTWYQTQDQCPCPNCGCDQEDSISCPECYKDFSMIQFEDFKKKKDKKSLDKK